MDVGGSRFKTRLGIVCLRLYLKKNLKEKGLGMGWLK
jgi:hypothetical protein